MKRLIILLALILFAAAGCKEKKPAGYTRLGFYTQYQTYMEKLNGKVESVTEKGYWAIPEGDTYVKGDRITKKELDSLGYTYDYKAIFDADGYPVSSTTYDENDRVIDSWHLSKVNNLLAGAGYIADDTLRYRHVITCDDTGYPFLYESYDALTDTLAGKSVMEGSCMDTIKIQNYNYRGDPGTRILMIFNETGLLTHVEYYGADGTPGSSYSFVYNDRGFQSEATFLDKDKIVTARTYSTYEYDEKGNWVKSIFKDEKGFAVLCERVYTYFE